MKMANSCSASSDAATRTPSSQVTLLPDRLGRATLVERTHLAIFLVALRHPRCRLERQQPLELLGDGLAHQASRRIVIAVRAAGRLAYQSIGDAPLTRLRTGQIHLFRPLLHLLFYCHPAPT